MQADIGILTVLADSELPAVLRAFELDPKGTPNRIDKGMRYWDTSLQSVQTGRKLKIIITAVGEAGNPNASAATTRLLKDYKPKFVCLVGIAAGVPGKLALGDIVVARYILGYETEKLLPDGPESRPSWKEPRFAVKQDLEHFLGQIDLVDLERRISAQTSLLDSTKLPPLDLVPHTRSIKKNAVIASGEKIFGDGSLGQLAEKHNDERIIAGEMEGIGFAISAEREECSWLVVRGISDHGEPISKDGRQKDMFHNLASIAAAEFIRAFIERGYTGPIVSTLKSDPIKDLFGGAPPITVRTVLMSMHDKNGVEPLLAHFQSHGVTIIATPNTARILQALGCKPKTTYKFTKCRPISMSRGTLHPYILAAIAADPLNPRHLSELQAVGISKIDMIFVNTKDPAVSDEDDPSKVLQQLTEVQIGGPSLLRWAIKNWRTCSAVVDSSDYRTLLQDLKRNDNQLSLSTRIRLLMYALSYLSYKDNQTANLLKAFWPPVSSEGSA